MAADLMESLFGGVPCDIHSVPHGDNHDDQEVVHSASSLPAKTAIHLVDGKSHLFTWEPAPTEAAGDPVLAAATLSETVHSLTSIPVLNSNPGAAASLYLDFDGHFQASWGAWSNITTPVYDDDGDASTFSDEELATIYTVWQRVAEDFMPFNINVTTVEPAALAAGAPESGANGKALRIAIGGTSDWMGASWGGYAYINSFTSSIANVAYVFAGGSNSVAWMGNVVSHEAGHAFGLHHQSEYDANGVRTSEYHPGTETWLPLMGTSSATGEKLSTWHNGTDALGPTSLQDDIAEIARPLNVFGYRGDDHGNTLGAATPMSGGGTEWTASGFVGAGGDIDWFSLDLAQPENLLIAASGPVGLRNLDVAIELRDAAGALIATASPGDAFDASIVRNLVGRHYIGVKSNGEYGRLGQYTVTVTESLAGVEATYPRAPFTTSESGRSESVTLVLKSKPTSDVVFSVASSDTTEAVVSASALIFTPANWYLPQTVTVTGVADGVADGAAAYSVAFAPAVSDDPSYNGFELADVDAVNLDAAPGHVYWIRSDLTEDVAVVERATPAGDGVQTVLDITAAFSPSPVGYYNPGRLTIDAAGGKLYWTDASNKTISRANLDGSAPEVVLTLANGPTDVAIDPAGGKIYWADSVLDKIQRANLDGSGVEDVIADGLVTPSGLELDLVAGKLYWSDNSTYEIRRANLDGSNVEIIRAGDGVNLPQSITLDVSSGKIYYGLRQNFDTQQLYRANLDGSSEEMLVDLDAIDPSTANPVVQGIAIDHASGRIVWSESLRQRVYSADLDGGNVAVVSEAGMNGLRGIAMLPALPGFTITPTSGLTTTEGGGTASFTVALNAPPSADVTIPVSTSDATEGTPSATSLTFTPFNWHVPQTITVSGVDDLLTDQHVGYLIALGTAASADPAYAGLNPPDVSITNLDNDAPLFFDSFEISEWNGLWVEDSQNDWFRSPQRATDGARSAEVDGSASNAAITMANGVNLTPFGSAELTFSWLIESSFDAGEYLAVDVFNGAWREVKRLRGNVDAENVWRHETVELLGADLTSNFKIRFRASVSGSDEDANVDNVKIAATSVAGPPDQAPTADAGGPYAGVEGSPVQLSAAGSADPDGVIVGYAWDLDNDGQYDDASGPSPTFQSTIDGMHEVSVRVTDDRGGSAVATTAVVLANAAPVASAGGGYSGSEGSALTLSAAGSIDPGHDIVSYAWDLDGDGAFDDAAGQTVAFTPADDGGLGIAVRVTDEDGANATATATVTVANVAPTAALGGPYSAAPHAPITLQASAVDPGDDVLTYEWDFDYDGVTFSMDAAGVNLSQPAASYAAVGSYTIALRVRDDDGGVSSLATADVTVSSAPQDVLYFSLLSSATVDGVAAANEDLLAVDAAGSVRLLFDGSDVGLSGATLSGFSVVDADELLLSFASAISLPGLGSVDDSDIVRFTATSLGNATAGSFSLYFDGSDVGLTTSGERISALHALPDNRLLLSTTGSASVPGASSAAQDLLLFTPSSLGANTAGSWSVYFDGSDVGLSNSSESIDAVAVDDAGRLYLSTTGNFSVSGLSGANEDVFVFMPASLGDSTSGTFSSSLKFDGSSWGLAGNDVTGVDVPVAATAAARARSLPAGSGVDGDEERPLFSASSLRPAASGRAPQPWQLSSLANLSYDRAFESLAQERSRPTSASLTWRGYAPATRGVFQLDEGSMAVGLADAALAAAFGGD